MHIQLALNNGTVEEINMMSHILRTYDVRVENMVNLPEKNEMGGNFIPILIILLPEISQFLQTILPAIQTYIEIQKPTGTKHEIEFINGDKKIRVTNDDGTLIDFNEIAKFCNKINFFD